MTNTDWHMSLHYLGQTVENWATQSKGKYCRVAQTVAKYWNRLPHSMTQDTFKKISKVHREMDFLAH